MTLFGLIAIIAGLSAIASLLFGDTYTLGQIVTASATITILFAMVDSVIANEQRAKDFRSKVE